MRSNGILKRQSPQLLLNVYLLCHIIPTKWTSSSCIKGLNIPYFLKVLLRNWYTSSIYAMKLIFHIFSLMHILLYWVAELLLHVFFFIRETFVRKLELVVRIGRFQMLNIGLFDLFGVDLRIWYKMKYSILQTAHGKYY